VAKTDRRAELLRDGLERVAEAAHFLGLSRSSIYTLMARGALPFVMLGKSRRIPRRAVFELAAKGLVDRPVD
jgi:excisionase family DNA binding protein